MNSWLSLPQVAGLLTFLSIQLQSEFTLHNVWRNMQEMAQHESLGSVTGVFVLLALLLMICAPMARGRIRTAAWLFSVALLLMLTSSILAAMGLPAGATTVHWVALVCGGVAIVNLASLVVFDVALALAHVHTPRILRDLVVACAYIGVGFALLAHNGVSFTGLITTSAVLTAVIGFSLQDTLGNIMGGLALQMEKTINVGDWVRIDQQVGRVKEIRWRHTALETRNWDTLVIPNSILMKGQVLVLGRRTGQPVLHRQWVYFNVDFRIAPTEVISAVNDALQAEPIPGVAEEPRAHGILFDFKESYCQYAVRYWLTDLAADDPTDSLIRTRIYFALKRHGISLSIPAQSVFVTEDSEAHKDLHLQKQVAHRLAALAGVELFHTLNENERHVLAERLHPAPFVMGEAMTRQGTEAHSLYILTKGSADVAISVADAPRKVIATLHAGDFFGEMSLMTGDKRSATVVALEDVECYRLDKDAFHDILQKRPEIAEHISHVLARRRMEHEAAREGLDAEARRLHMQHTQGDMFARISAFFGLGSVMKV
jgi:small-conductance mechanosensitive channel/CRP-like cAMP-binding protein